MPREIVGFTQDNGIIPPENFFRTDTLAQGDEIVPQDFKRRDMRLQISGIPGEGVQKVMGNPQIVQLMKPGVHRTRMPGPEHDGIDVFRMQGHVPALRGIEGIPDRTESLGKPVEKPVRIKGRDVCSSAGGNDHGSTALNQSVAVQEQTILRITRRLLLSA